MAGGAPAIMLVAGEASGDLHGAGLCRALRGLEPACRLFGMGGARMAAAGMDLMEDVTATAVVGHREAVGQVPRLFGAYRTLRAALSGPERPGVLVLIDFPEFNLRLARAARRAGVPVVYFIPPQIWAWRGHRVKAIRRFVSLVLAVFPFEPALYRGAGVPVEFVGHPVLDQLVGAPTRESARRALGIEDGALVVGLLPGSRQQEIVSVLPAMLEAAAQIGAAVPGTRFALGLAPTIDRRLVEGQLSGGPPVAIVGGQTYAVVRAADLLLATSGTVTLEAALLGTPMVVGYRLSRVSELFIRLLIRVPWVSLANLTLGRAVVPELYQRAMTGAGLAGAALPLLKDAGARETQRIAFGELAGQLGEPGVGTRAAQLVLAQARR
ncbi:MAG: lipid-A-disaccharide synthase [Candidatus Rokuibacteriota bacterium]|nr:MAG: lipid-A-disaccharide synthase [Candidatus Rokubacteria bacterium]